MDAIVRMAAALEAQNELREQELEQARRSEAAHIRWCEAKETHTSAVEERNRLVATLLQDVRILIERCDLLLATVPGHRSEYGQKLDAVLEILRAWVAYRMQIGSLPEEAVAPLAEMLKAISKGAQISVQTGGTALDAERDVAVHVEGDLRGT